MPRAYEVSIGQLIKNVSDATDKLMDLQKKVKELDDDKKVTGPTNVTNALFVGSTADLQKMLKEMDNGRKGKGNAALKIKKINLIGQMRVYQHLFVL